MKHTALIFLLLWSAILLGQDYGALVSVANKHYENKAFQLSVDNYQAAFGIDATKPGDLYNAACSAALAGGKRRAFKWLDLAFKNGWTNLRHLQSDTDLNALHGNWKWTKLVASMQAEVDKLEANYDKPLQAELLGIFDEDQGIRREYIAAQTEYGFVSPKIDSLGQIMTYRDSVNLLKVLSILDKHGWVGGRKRRAAGQQYVVLGHSAC